MFICGSASFSHDLDEDEISSNPISKKSRKSMSYRRIGKDYSTKNPYANRGLDKFYALLTELEEKRQKIYAQMGSEDISFVKFVYSSDSEHIKPIVVKVKERNQDMNATTDVKNSIERGGNDPVMLIRSSSAISSKEILQKKKIERNQKKQQKKKRCFLRCYKEWFKIENLAKPSYYFPFMVVLILFFLAIFGRTFAILCTSVAWYLIPSITGESFNSSSNTRKANKKKLVINKNQNPQTSAINWAKIASE